MRHLRKTELRYPRLWRGCVGAWAPCLGPTGFTLRDWSGCRSHGTLNNMDPGTDWVLSGGRYALDFDGTNDYVNAPDAPHLNFSDFRFTLSIWANIRSITGAPFIINKTAGGGTIHYALGLNSGQQRFFAGGTEINSGFTPTSGVWVHYAATCDGTAMATYRNGVRQATGTRTSSQTTTAALTIGVLWGSNWVNGQFDDARVYNRALNANEISLLAARRGIAYETARRRRSVSSGASSRRRRLLLLGQE